MLGMCLRLRPICRFLPLVILAVWATSATAQPSEQRDDPRALKAFERGEEHYEAERWDEAIAAFKEALTYQREPVLVFNVGRAYERKGERAQAIAWFERYLTMTISSKDRADAKVRLARLRASRPGTIRLDALPAGATVFLDGVVVPADALPALSVTPGEHRIRVIADGRTPFETSVTVRPAATHDLRLSLPEVVGPPAPATGMSGLRTGMWVSAGLTAALGLTAIGLTIASELERDRVRGAERDSSGRITSVTMAEAREIEAHADTLQTVSAVGYGLAAAALTTTLILRFVEPDPPRGSVRVGVAPTQGGLFFTLSWSASDASKRGP